MAMLAGRGMCCDEEALVKSFLPSLFDSDSDAEETFLVPDGRTHSTLGRCNGSHKTLHVHLGKPMKKTTSSEAFSQVQVYNKRPLTDGDVTLKEEQPEASSPSSQGNSNASSQTPFSGALESSDSMDSSSPFYSVLSFESSDSIFDFDSAPLVEEPPAKRQKVHSSAILRQSPSPVSGMSIPGYGFRAESSTPCSLISAQSVPSPSRLQPALLSRSSLPAHCPLPFTPAEVTTGIPVDSCPAVSMPERGDPADFGKSWMSPQSMAPTKLPTIFYPGHYGSRIPSNLPAPVTSTEKIAAALMDVKKAPLMASPLGLQLDKKGLASSLAALGMILKD